MGFKKILIIILGIILLSATLFSATRADGTIIASDVISSKTNFSAFGADVKDFWWSPDAKNLPVVNGSLEGIITTDRTTYQCLPGGRCEVLWAVKPTASFIMSELPNLEFGGLKYQKHYIMLNGSWRESGGALSIGAKNIGSVVNVKSIIYVNEGGEFGLRFGGLYLDPVLTYSKYKSFRTNTVDNLTDGTVNETWWSPIRDTVDGPINFDENASGMRISGGSGQHKGGWGNAYDIQSLYTPSNSNVSLSAVFKTSPNSYASSSGWEVIYLANASNVTINHEADYSLNSFSGNTAPRRVIWKANPSNTHFDAKILLNVTFDFKNRLWYCHAYNITVIENEGSIFGYAGCMNEAGTGTSEVAVVGFTNFTVDDILLLKYAQYENPNQPSFLLYSFNITGDNLSEFNAAPSVPEWNAPLNGSVFASVSFVANWTNSTDFDGDARTYLLEVSNQSDFSSVTYRNASIRETNNITGDNVSGLALGLTYWMRVLANDGTDNSSWSVLRTVILQSSNVAPNITLIGPSNASNLTNASVLFRFNATDDGALGTCELWGNWTGSWSWNYSWIGPNSGLVNLTSVVVPDGSWSWGVWCNDTGGLGNWSVNYSFILDATGPSVSLVNVTSLNGSIVSASNKALHNQNVSFSVTVSDALSGMKSVILTIWQTVSGTGVKLYEAFLNLVGGVWNAQDIYLNLSFPKGVVMNYTVNATDSFGNPTYYLGNFTVGNTPPSSLNLLSPSNSSSIWDNTPTLVWLNSTDNDSDARTYILEVSQYANFSSVIYQNKSVAETNNITNDTVIYLPDGLPDGAYWWRVRAHDGESNSSWSLFNFIMNVSSKISAPRWFYPSNNSPLQTNSYNLVWNNSIDDDGDILTYQVQVDNDTDFSNPEIVNVSVAQLFPVNLTGLVGWWKLEKGNGTFFNDSSGNGNFGVCTNCPVYTAEGKFGGAYDNKKVNGITVADSNSLDTNTTTVSLWVNLKNVTYTDIIRKHTSPADRGWIIYTGRTPSVGVNNISATICASGACEGANQSILVGPVILDDVWYHIVMRYNLTGLALFINGYENVSSSFVKGIYSNTQMIRFGDSFQTTNNLNGTIDEVMIWNRSLSAAEVLALYQNSDKTNITISGLQDGVYTARVLAKDSSINSSWSYLTWNQSQDSPPNITFVNVTSSNGSIVSITSKALHNQNVSFSVNATDDLDVPEVLVTVWETVAGAGIKLYEKVLGLIGGLWTSADLFLNLSFSKGTVYNFTVNASDGLFITNYEGNFTVGNTMPSQVSLVTANNTNTTDTTPFLRWGSASDNDSDPLTYLLQVSGAYDFSAINYSNASVVQLNDTTTVLADGTYYWRVRANDGEANGSWSLVYSFNIDTANPRVFVTSPNEGQSFTTTASHYDVSLNLSVIDGNPVLCWYNLTDTTKNELLSATSEYFTCQDGYTASFEVKNPYLILDPGTDSYTLMLTGTDSSGLTNSTSRNFTIEWTRSYVGSFIPSGVASSLGMVKTSKNLTVNEPSNLTEQVNVTQSFLDKINDRYGFKLYYALAAIAIFAIVIITAIKFKVL